MKKEKKSFLEKIINFLLDVMIFIFGIVLLVSLYIGIQTKVFNNDYANFFGYSLFEVQTGSMSGKIEAGDWIIIQLTQNVKLNDVVTYKSDGEFITHRIVEVYNNTYVTQGDANTAKDKPIDSKQIIGKVTKVLPKFGIIRKTLLNPAVLIAIIITLILFNMAIKKDKNSKVINKIKETCNKIFKKKDQNVASKANDELAKEIELKKENEKEIEKIIEPDELKIVEIESPKVEAVTENNDTIESETSNDGKKEEVNEIEEKNLDELDDMVYRESDLEKTAMFRYILVDEAEMNRDPQEKVDEIKEEIEEINEEEVEEKTEPTEEEKDASLKEMNNGKRCKNIIDRFISVKLEELNELTELLEGDNKNSVNEATIKSEFNNMYVKVRYYPISNSKLKFEDEVMSLSKKLIQGYKGSDQKFSNKVNKYEKMFMSLYRLEQIWESDEDSKKKQQQYVKAFIKLYGKDNMQNLNARYLMSQIIRVRRKYENILDYFLKKLETNMFELELNKLKEVPNTYGLSLKHNIEFNKIYSSYVIDKTYSEGIVAEDRMAVLITLLLKQIIDDMMKSKFERNYILYLPSTLYEKEKKIERLFNAIDDSYVKDKVIILVNINDFLNYKGVIKQYIKEGYRFSIVYDNEVKVGYENYGNLYAVNHIFINKETIDVEKAFSFIPEEICSKFVYEDIYSRVDDFGSE